MRTKAKILIIENSDIIQQGLAFVLTQKNKTSLLIELYTQDCDVHQVLLKTMPQILIAPPAVFDEHHKVIRTQKELHGLQTVGLIYAYHHPDTLSHIDKLIYLGDKNQTITTIINNLLLSPSQKSTNKSTSSNDILSEREKDVLKLLAEGSSTKQIAETLFISPHTVNAHRKNIMRKLDIKTISGLTIYAVLNNIITLKEG